MSGWFQAARDSLCRKEIKHYHQRVRRIVEEVEGEMGMRRMFWRRVKDEEVNELIEMYEMREREESVE